MEQANVSKKNTRAALPPLLFLILLALSPTVSFSSEPSNGYVGEAVCRRCHQDYQRTYDKTIHARVFKEGNARTPLMERGCEACHGPGKAHVEGKDQTGGLLDFSAATPEAMTKENDACLACHEKDHRLYWKGSVHEMEDIPCTGCHTIMEKHSERALLSKPTEVETCVQCHFMRRAQLFRNAHMPLREGKMTCTSCHNQHGTAGKALLTDNWPNETCYRCHADKRGPFLWEHAPVTENCMNCHDPHGSVRPWLLKLSLPRLCQQCHVPTAHPTEARLPGNKFVIGASCMQCHRNIHGSNHPAGFAFTR
jgi:DmsE family decaheme c-type cytochrome